MTEMDLDTAVGIVVDDEDADEDTYAAAWQYLVDSGHVWTLGAWYQRTARKLISHGALRENKTDKND
jgi:hypothetical protein